MTVMSWILVSVIIGMIVKLSKSRSGHPQTEVIESGIAISSGLVGTIIGSAISYMTMGATLLTLPGLLISFVTTILVFWNMRRLLAR